jgi:GAF domain-containing protein
MAEAELLSDLPTERSARYEAVFEILQAVLEGEPDPVARVATVVGVLTQAFAPRFFWCGVYRVDPADPAMLVVGPYQGTLGCLRIPVGRGVCGTAAARQEAVLVPDVHAFPGHIACDGRSRSEVVVPYFDGDGALAGVLDVDSAEPAAFDERDVAGLERVLGLLAAG